MRRDHRRGRLRVGALGALLTTLWLAGGPSAEAPVAEVRRAPHGVGEQLMSLLQIIGFNDQSHLARVIQIEQRYPLQVAESVANTLTRTGIDTGVGSQDHARTRDVRCRAVSSAHLS